ncbi:FecR family protein [Carboxylicivirga sp. M1479]|uniref:FecR family protein n=1 Tax=Carboxylicivirga sp. M1479 TaxID=2594476 RepID=UPI00117753A0|nr:FecR domain-containing protein [Carboxylicivirga sp. M1479]TRX71437.1 DUF4974 domain-containing protein [Carboxylicivirga sp. M1479]
MVKKKIDIEYIVIWRNLNNVASAEEQSELRIWLDANDKHRLLYEHIKVRNEHDVVITEDQIEQRWLKLQHTLDKKPSIGIKRWLQYAAAIILPIAVAAGVFYLSDKSETKLEMAHQITPGSAKAVLHLSNGELLELDDENKLFIEDEHGNVIGVDSTNTLRYNANASMQASYNTINIPRGAEYQLVLSDGTKVWLNSESSLTYPVNFVGESREVLLTGEAFFDVTTNREKPFIVKTNKSSVKVFGTQFNVMSYADEAIEQTTLVEGSIAVLYNNQEVMVKPGQQANIQSSGAEMSIVEVDTQLYTDWKDGVFRFEEMTLKEVASKLSRWYNVDFYFANEDMKGRMITGAMKRSTDFELLMSLVEKSAEVEIVINENTVLVKGK